MILVSLTTGSVPACRDFTRGYIPWPRRGRIFRIPVTTGSVPACRDSTRGYIPWPRRGRWILHSCNAQQLAYVAKGAKEFARRSRELRTEDGYAIATRFTGRPDLGMGEYVLLSAERIAQPHDRHIPETVQKRVYERDANTCRLCGWNQAAWSETDPRFLELHHLEAHREGGANIERNLAVVCNKCHDDVHAGRREPDIAKLREEQCRMYSS